MCCMITSVDSEPIIHIVPSKAACAKILMSTLEACCINIANSDLCYLKVRHNPNEVIGYMAAAVGVGRVEKAAGLSPPAPGDRERCTPRLADSPLLMSPCWTHTCACIMVTLLNSHRGLFRPGGDSCGITLPTG